MVHSFYVNLRESGSASDADAVAGYARTRASMASGESWLGIRRAWDIKVRLERCALECSLFWSGAEGFSGVDAASLDLVQVPEGLVHNRGLFAARPSSPQNGSQLQEPVESNRDGNKPRRITSKSDQSVCQNGGSLSGGPHNEKYTLLGWGPLICRNYQNSLGNVLTGKERILLV